MNRIFSDKCLTKVKFAFLGNHIDRYLQFSRIVSTLSPDPLQKQREHRKPKIDLIMAVEDLKEFHSENMHSNKSHYTLFARGTHGHVVNFI